MTTSPDLILIVQTLLTALCGVLWYMFLQVKGKSEKNADDLATYKTHIAENFATTNDLTKAVETMGQNIQNVLSTVVRIEDRLYQRESRDNSANQRGNI